MNRGIKLLTALAVGAVGVAVATPNLIQARKHGDEASAIGALKTVGTSEATFREGDKEKDGYLDYGMLSELNRTGNIDSVLGSGVKQGYVFQASPGLDTKDFTWFGLANPGLSGMTGDRYFDTNQAGVIFTTPTPRPPETPFKAARGEDATSTFGADVDTASYSLVGRYLRHNTLPPPELVRTEELLNRFDVTDPAPPTDGKPFATRVEVGGCPWQPGHELVRIALRGRQLEEAQRPSTNLVFLIDVSGSMSPPERLPLLKQALRLLVERLGERDRVAIVVYAGAAGLVLPPTSGTQHEKILAAIDGLEAGGSTNGGAGIELAYRTAIESFVEGGMNRVILCTDGDFNVGISTPGGIEAFIEAKRKTGVFLSALGFGVDAEGDRIMQGLADRGNGHYAAIEDVREAHRVLVKEVAGTLFTIAKDVKIQVEWNRERVRSYRLLGYEKRALANADFKDDRKDAGEIGAGHRVTALYEIEPEAAPVKDGPLMTLRLRWKAPDSETSTGIELAVADAARPFSETTADFKLAASVAAGAMLLKGSEHAGEATWAKAIGWASQGVGDDRSGDRLEWIQLLRQAAALSGVSVGEDASARTPG
jgi:Ca-activated chloride channel family protein